jgi:uncharacterized protein (DUF885 family)
MLKRVLKWLGAVVTVVVIALAVFIVNLIWFRPWSLNLFYEKVFAEVVFDHPELLSTLGLVEQFGITSHNGKLDDESSAHQQQEFDRWKRDLTQLREHPRSPVVVPKAFCACARLVFANASRRRKVAVAQLSSQSALRRAEPISFFHGKHAPAVTRKDCEYYREASRCLPKKFDQLLENLKVREQNKFCRHVSLLRSGAQGNVGFCRHAGFENILATSFKTRAAKIAELTEAQRADFQGRVETAITGKSLSGLPKADRLFPRSVAENDHRRRRVETTGWRRITPTVFENTTTTLKPDEVHELGLREVTRIEGEMHAILDQTVSLVS